MKFFLNGTAIAVIAVLFSGCASLPNGRGWGQDATLFPGFARIGKAAKRAAMEPRTWVPAVGALVASIENVDHKISRWASEKNPVFGSKESAREWSNDLRSLTGVGAITTLAATPSGDQPLDWTAAKFKGVLVEGSALGVTSLVVGSLKDYSERDRPDGGDKRSFPSSHTSQAFAGARLASRNLESISMSYRSRRAWDATFLTMAAGTGWARIEAGQHYPSDVLAGAAIGNFLAVFIYDAFFGLQASTNIEISIDPSDEDMWIIFEWPF